jgi:putative nucleotidyltransferase with HDIG domain
METKKLTKEKAKEFALEIFSQIKGETDREFRIFHAKAVAKTAQALAEYDKAIDRDVLEMGAWLHDIGYIEGEDKHAERGIEILEKEGFILADKIADCVLHHGSWGKPRTKEGKVIQMADKISFINPGIIEILMRDGKMKDEEVDFLEKMLTNAIGQLRDFGEEIAFKS